MHIHTTHRCTYIHTAHTHTHTHIHTHVPTLHRSDEFSSCWTRRQLSAAIPAGYEATSSQWANQAPTAFTRLAVELLCTTTVHTVKSRFRRGSWLSNATRWKRRHSTVVMCASSDCLGTPGRRGGGGGGGGAGGRSGLYNVEIRSTC